MIPNDDASRAEAEAGLAALVARKLAGKPSPPHNPRPRNGIVEGRRDAGGRHYYRGRLYLQDGSLSPRIEIPEDKRYDRAAARDYVARCQEIEDRTHEIASAKGSMRSAAIVPGTKADPSPDTAAMVLDAQIAAALRRAPARLLQEVEDLRRLLAEEKATTARLRREGRALEAQLLACVVQRGCSFCAAILDTKLAAAESTRGIP